MGAHHVFWQGAGLLSDITTEFPSGIYTWSISGSNSNGTVSPSVMATSDAPPTFQPEILNGTWHNGRLRVLASDPRFQITQWANAPAGSRIEFELWGSGGAGGSTMGSSTTEVAWSPQPVGSIFSAFLSYRVIQNEGQATTSDGVVIKSRFGQAVTLYFEIEVVDSIGPVEEVPTVQISTAIQLRWQSQLSKTYQVQGAEDMSSWENVGDVLQGTGQEISFFAPIVTSQKFYRVIVTSGAASSLTILEATYGANDTFSDVASYIEAEIENNTVVLQVGNHTLGGDPIFGEPKTLYVRYRNESGEYEATISEGGGCEDS